MMKKAENNFSDVVFLKAGILLNACHYISMEVPFSTTFWHFSLYSLHCMLCVHEHEDLDVS